MNKRIHISKLKIIGEGVEPAIVEFKDGLNLISGPSDTGKSFIYDSLYFMINGNDAPDEDFEVSESKGYTTILLELKIGNKIYTIKRARKKASSAYVYACAIDEINDKTEYEKEYKGTGKDCLSHFFLQKLGLTNETKVLHTSKIVGNLTIGDLKNLFTVNESKIMDKTKSPILSRDNQAIRNKSVLSFLLANENYDDLDINNIETDILKNETKIKYAQQQINDLKDENEKLKNSSEYKEKNDILMGIDYLYQNQVDIKKEISEYLKNIDKLTGEVKTLNSERINLESTKNRFLLLEKFYKSDLKRLDFNKEGQNNFAELINIGCPTCGHQKAEANKMDIVNISNSIDSEKGKILLNMEQLKDSQKNVQLRLKEVSTAIAQKNNEMTDIADRYDYSIKPRLDFNSKKLKEYLNKQLIIKEVDKNDKRIEKYRDEISKFFKIIEENQNKKIDTSEILEKHIDKINVLGKEIKKIIIDWEIPISEKNNNSENIKIEYDFNKNDFKIDGRSRNSYGKGVRALLYAAFMVSFMEHCIADKDLYHPGLVIIDSPLTTFKEGKTKGPHDLEKDKELPKNVHERLFSYLAKDKTNQYIIIENDDKEPRKELNLEFNHIKFTKDKNNGRYGFFPLKGNE